MTLALTPADCLPADHPRALLVGRVWRPDLGGPSVVALRGDAVLDISAAAPTVAELLNADDPPALLRRAEGETLGGIAGILANSAHDARDPARPWFLAPVDLQAVKACGVTFADSMVERVIEEKAKGDPAAADAIRRTIADEIGQDLAAIAPGSAAAESLKAALIERGMWSQYLEVGIGPFAEIFTKCQPMAAVGIGAEIGLNRHSVWNNPEPEITLIINGRGEIRGASLGNDVNLRDIEGRSALLLGMAKDNNGSAAIGPFIRLFDETYTLDDARAAELTLRVEGPEGFALDGSSSVARISRDLADLAAAAIGPDHQYPDGLALMTGTLFSPTQDRDAPGGGFTHRIGDVVRIQTPLLGSLVNRVSHSHRIPPWRFGAGALMRNLAGRGLL